MSEQQLRMLLEDMRQAAAEAVSFVEGLSEDAFLKHVMAQRAVTMNIHTIGEAATVLALKHPKFVEQHPEFPMNEMRGMRNRIAHGYRDINFHTVYKTAKEDLPELIEQIDGALAELGAG